MPARGFQKPEPRTTRVKVGLTAREAEQLATKARAAGMTVSAYLAAMVSHHLGDSPRLPTPARNHGTMVLLAEVHALAMQIKKIGTNVNQLAHQANTGLVPLSLKELRIMQVQVAVAMDKAAAVFEKVLRP